MYCIITENKEIYDFAKNQGEQFLEKHKNLIIDLEDEKKSPKTVDEFLAKFGFSGIDMQSLGARCIKYVIENNVDCNKTSYREIFHLLANRFRTFEDEIASEMFITYVLCRSCIPVEYEKYFEELKLCRDSNKNIFQFIKICQKHLKETGVI